jgi:hypothetical protein
MLGRTGSLIDEAAAAGLFTHLSLFTSPGE